jgi:hypothetical protein
MVFDFVLIYFWIHVVLALRILILPRVGFYPAGALADNANGIRSFVTPGPPTRTTFARDAMPYRNTVAVLQQLRGHAR